MTRRLAAEFIGTLWLVLGGCGSAVLAAAFPALGIGFVGVALAFGLTLLTMAYAIGHVSGCHLNPAVSVGPVRRRAIPGQGSDSLHRRASAGGESPAPQSYMALCSGHAGFRRERRLRISNGYGAHSPGGYSLGACLLTEIVMTFGFLFVIMGSTHGSAPKGFAPHRHRAVPHPDSPDQHPGDQHLRQSRAQHGTRAVRGRLGAVAAVAVLAGADPGWRSGRCHLSLGERRSARSRSRGRIGRPPLIHR